MKLRLPQRQTGWFNGRPFDSRRSRNNRPLKERTKLIKQDPFKFDLRLNREEIFVREGSILPILAALMPTVIQTGQNRQIAMRFTKLSLTHMQAAGRLRQSRFQSMPAILPTLLI